MVSKEKLIKDGASPELAETLMRDFYIKEQNSNDTFTQYWIKRIDEKIDKLHTRDELTAIFNEINTKINNLPTKDNITTTIQEELKHYPTNKELYKIILTVVGLSTGFLGLLMTLFKFIH